MIIIILTQLVTQAAGSVMDTMRYIPYRLDILRRSDS
jgi:hypothetical protein